MQYKHIIRGNRIKVFLSSSMEDNKFIEQRNMIISFIERMPLFELFAVENYSSDQPIQNRYVDAVKRTDIVLLILQTKLREGVENEYQAAIRNEKRIFAFIHNGKKNSELKKFVEEVNNKVTSTKFNDNKELIDKIESTLLEDLVEKYVKLHEDNASLKKRLESLSNANFE